MFRRSGYRFADKNMRHSGTLEHVPIPTERDMLKGLSSMISKACTHVLSIVALTMTAGVAHTQTTVEFKTISIVVGSSAGGGYDTYARILARHIGRHLRGPTITAGNMPGAPSLKAVQYLDTGAPKDGSVITAFNPGLLNESLLNADKI